MVSWNRLGPLLGPSWALLGRPRLLLGLSWPVVEPSWRLLGSSWGFVGAVWGRLETVLEPLGAVLGPSSAVLGQSWGLSWSGEASQGRISQKPMVFVRFQRLRKEGRFMRLDATGRGGWSLRRLQKPCQTAFRIFPRLNVPKGTVADNFDKWAQRDLRSLGTLHFVPRGTVADLMTAERAPRCQADGGARFPPPPGQRRGPHALPADGGHGLCEALREGQPVSAGPFRRRRHIPRDSSI